MKKLLAFFAICFFIAPRSEASTCMPSDFFDRYQDAALIFIGSVKDVSYPEKESQCSSKIAKFDVTETLKGVVGKEISIYSGEGCMGMGMPFEKGVAYLVYSAPLKNIYNSKTGKLLDYFGTNICMGTENLPQVKVENLEQLRLRKKQIDDLDVAITRHPELANSLQTSKSEIFLDRHDYSQAETILQALWNKDRKNYFHYIELMKSLIGQAKYKEAWKLHEATTKPKIGPYDTVYQNLIGQAINQSYNFIGPINNLSLESLEARNINLAKRILNDPVFNQVRIIDSNFENTTFNNANFQDVTFEQGTLKGTVFKNSKMKNVSIENDFENADFSGLEATLLKFSYLPPNVIFKNAKLIKASFYKANLQNTDFSHAELLDCNLYDADLSRAVLIGVSLKGSTYSCKTKWPQGFDPIIAGAEQHPSCEN